MRLEQMYLHHKHKLHSTWTWKIEISNFMDVIGNRPESQKNPQWTKFVIQDGRLLHKQRESLFFLYLCHELVLLAVMFVYL